MNTIQPVHLATTGPISIRSAPGSFGGVTPEPGQRVLVKDQKDPVENGIYIWHGEGRPMTLAPDSPRDPRGVFFHPEPPRPPKKFIDVRLATTGPISIHRAPAMVDGVACSPGDRILVKDQPNPAENGIYIWHAEGEPMSLAEDSPRNPQGNVFQQNPPAPPRHEVRCRVIDRSATGSRAPYETATADPSYRYFPGAGGSTDLLCGACDRILVEQLRSSTDVRDAVMKCPSCGVYNDSGTPTN